MPAETIKSPPTPTFDRLALDLLHDHRRTASRTEPFSRSPRKPAKEDPLRDQVLAHLATNGEKRPEFSTHAARYRAGVEPALSTEGK